MKQATSIKASNHARSSRPRRTKSNPNPENRQLGWEVVLNLGVEHLNHFVKLAPKFLEDKDADAIHDFRVASRRLQQIVDIVYAAPRPKRIRKLRRVIQRSRHILSTVRNCDVLMQRVEESLARKRTAHRESWEAFKDYVSEQRSDNYQKAVGKLSKINLSAFYVRLRESLQAPPIAPKPSDVASSGGPEFVKAVESEGLKFQVFRALQANLEAFDTQVANAQKETEPRVLHPVRIAAKKLRYLIEVIHELGAPDTDQILKQLKGLQQNLGDWHDMEVMEQMMADMLARPAFLLKNINLAMKTERLMLRNQKIKAAHEKKYLETSLDPEAWSRLKTWVENLPSTPPLNVAEP